MKHTERFIWITALTILVACSSNYPRPTYVDTLWAADSLKQEIFDKDGNTVKCDEPRFDDYICRHKDLHVAVESYINLLQQSCKEW